MAQPVFPVTFWNRILYQSVTNLSASGNTAVIASNAGAGSEIVFSPPNAAIYPLVLQAVGNNMATDETNDLTITWFAESVGLRSLGVTTFAQMTAGAPNAAVEAWPGDVSLWNAGRDNLPLPPFMQLAWTLAGTTKSMGFTVFLSGTTFGSY